VRFSARPVPKIPRKARNAASPPRSKARALASVEEVARDPAVQGAVVSASAASHYALARTLLEAGKDVYVEKPLALEVAHAETLVRIARERSRILMVGHLLLYHPAVRYLKDLIARGELGDLYYIYSQRVNLGKVRQDENALWSFAPHDVAVIVRLLGETPVRVSAQGGNYLHATVADVTVSTLEFASGVRGHIFVSWLHPFKEHKLVVVGEKQMAVFDDNAEQKLMLFPHRIEWVNRRPVPEAAAAVPVPLENLEPLAEECRHFLDCVATHRQPRTDGSEGARLIRVLEACEQSLAQNGGPIAVRVAAAPAVDYYVHPTAVVEPGAHIGTGTKIWHYAHILGDTHIGAHCTFGQNTVVMPGVRVGDNVKVQNNVSLFTGVVLEDDVFCGPSLTFTNVRTPRSAVPRRHAYEPTVVHTGATLGANATIVCGHTIGRHAFVGAGAVVTADVADYALVVGNPARQVGWMCVCGARLPATVPSAPPPAPATARCAACGTVYQYGEAGIRRVSEGS